MNQALALFLGILGPVLGILSAVWVTAMGRAAQRESRTIADLRADVLDERTRREEAESALRLTTDYAHILRRQIARELYGEPMPWPDGLKP